MSETDNQIKATCMKAAVIYYNNVGSGANEDKVIAFAKRLYRVVKEDRW